MKKIYKLVKGIGRFYGGYDLHVTKNHIEVKFSPYGWRSDDRIESKEVVFATGLLNDTLDSFGFNLERHLRKLEEQN